MVAEVQDLAPSKPTFWNDPRVRALIYQALVLGGVVAFGAYLVHNTLRNLEAMGIASGFDFLGKTAGFDISQALVPYQAESPRRRW